MRRNWIYFKPFSLLGKWTIVGNYDLLGLKLCVSIRSITPFIFVSLSAIWTSLIPTAVHVMNKYGIIHVFWSNKNVSFSVNLQQTSNDGSIANANDLPLEEITNDFFPDFVNFYNDFEECVETSDSPLNQSNFRWIWTSQKCTIKKVSSHVEVNNICDFIRRFLEGKPNAYLNLFYKLENQISDLFHSQSCKQSKIYDFSNK